VYISIFVTSIVNKTRSNLIPKSIYTS